MRWLEHRIPPPVIDLACIGLMWLLARAVPAAQLWSVGAYPLGVGAGLGLALALMAGWSCGSAVRMEVLSA